jgi:hypothetical protein
MVQASEEKAVSPEFRWAQRRDRILLTIDLQVHRGQRAEEGRNVLRGGRDRAGERDGEEEVPARDGGRGCVKEGGEEGGGREGGREGGGGFVVREHGMHTEAKARARPEGRW